MKLADVYNKSINESLDSRPYPIYKRSNTTYNIDADGTTIQVILNGLEIDRVNCLSLKFVNPLDTANTMNATGRHNNRPPLRVFSTIVHLINPVDFNLLICVAEDTNIDIEKKKGNLYRVIFTKLMRERKIHNFHTLNIEQFDKPILVAERNISLPAERIEEIVVEFAYKHLV